MRPVIPAVTVLAATALAASTALAQEGNPPEPVRSAPETRLAAPGNVKPTLKLALDAIKADRGALSTKQRGAVNTRLTGIQNALKRGDNCAAVQGLRSLRGGVAAAKGVAGDAGRPRMNIAAASLQAEALLKFSSKTKNCGGGATPPRTNLAGRVPEQSKTGLALRLGMPVPRFDAETIGPKSFVGLRSGDIAPQGGVGEPGLPFASQVIAIPEGAGVKVMPGPSDGITLSGVDLAPVQEDPEDQDPGEPAPVLNAESPELRRTPLALNTTAYSARRLFPSRSFSLQSLGTVGGVRLAVLSVPTARYIPSSRQLRITTAANFTVEFTGGKGTFADTRLKLADNADTAQLLAASVINFKTVAGALAPVSPKPCGEDLIIITPPALKPAADRLSIARNAKGVKTEVFQYGAAPVGATKESLKAFIQSRVAVPECAKTVKWVLLLGDSNLIPTWLAPKEGGSGTIATDVTYSQSGGSFTLPNVGMGRIPAGTLAQAENAVTKQIAYTDTPPAAGNAFYNKATVAGYFQIKECDDNGNCSYPNGKSRESRRYMTSVTKVFSGLQAFGKTVDKYITRQAESLPFFLNDGSFLPAAFIGTGPYTGTGEGVRNAINDGRWLVFHRDHAGPGGWGDPGFNATLADTLSNGNELPLVLSINCSSGRFDDAGQNTFVDRLLFNPNGGAVGIISATRNTPSFRNEEFARPLANALTGGKVSSAGHWLFPISTPIRRASSVMYWGQLLLGMRAGFDATWRNMLRYYHYFGDPSVKIYTNGPA